MAVNSTLFVAIPAAALLLNLFLLLVCISAKKSKLVIAFMLLVASYSIWSGGSLGMRAMIYPGAIFWFKVSFTGILLVPFMIYNFVYEYTEQKGTFTRSLMAVSWFIIIVLANLDLFIKSPAIASENATRSFEYTLTNWTILPILYGVFTLGLTFHMIFKSIAYKGQSLNAFTPFFLGTGVLFVGLLLTVIPGFGSFPIDPLACGINALFLFYALYKKRLITFKMVASRGPLYLSAIIMMTALMTVLYSSFEEMYDRRFPQYIAYKPIVFSVILSILTVLVYNLIRKALFLLFNKTHATREEELRRFSREINESLDDKQILKTFCDLIERNMDCDMAYVLVSDDSGNYVTEAATLPVLSGGIAIRSESPVIEWLKEHNLSITYKDFTRTKNFHAMWESEKSTFVDNNIKLLLPIAEGKRLLALALFADRGNHKNYSPGEITFLESAGAVMSIATKNALLYAAMQKEAYTDTLTGLYNRRYFNSIAKKQFEQAKMHTLSVVLISFDDFTLYRELYGSLRIETVLKDMAKILLSAIGSQGCVARYSEREFIISIPFIDTEATGRIIEVIRNLFKNHVDNKREHGYRHLTFSAGICTYPVSSSNLEETINYAGVALYTAKKNGKNRTQVYSTETSGKALTPEAMRFGEQCERTIYALTAAIDAKDHYTFQHSQNVSLYGAKLAEYIGLDPEHVEIIRQAGLLHDVGKIGIPESILSKEGKLTDEELAIMREHPEASVAMIKYLPSLDYVVPAAFSHHERWDGKGYPRGIAGEDIPIAARCLCIVDAFDAMTTQRSYKAAMSVEDALDEIRRNLGTQFDAKIGLAFIKLAESGDLAIHKV
ncbi:MAG: diguanylate cyclase [Clostridiales bacterium]|nr:diguanylate cyclase [Clostridiales bacterium]